MLFATVGQKKSRRPMARARRLGRLRAVLRLGERADAGPPRRAVLAAIWRCNAGGTGAGAGLRHRPDLASARARRRPARRHRSIRGDARFRAAPDASRAASAQSPAGAGRHPAPAVSACRAEIGGEAWPARALRDGDGAVRHSAVAAARARSRGDADGGAPRPRAGRHVRTRARRRPAVVGGVPQAGQPEGLARSSRRRARHAGRNSPPGSQRGA